MGASPSIRVLIVDDDDDIRLLARTVIEAADHGLVVSGEAANGTEALARLDTSCPTVVVLDQMMPQVSGLETAAKIRERFPNLPIVLFSAYVTGDLEAAASRHGIDVCLPKTHVMRLPDVVRRLAAA